MSRRVAALTLDTVGDLAPGCRRCVFWELDPVAGQRAVAGGDPAFEKEAWLSSVLLEWGSCGRVLFVDDEPAGHVVYAPPAFVPRSVGFPTSPVGPDAVVLMGCHVAPGFRGGGLGRVLVQAAAKDLVRRGVRAVEAFGRAGPAEPVAVGRGAAGADSASGGGAGPGDDGHDPVSACFVPADFLLAVGFATVRPHHRYPRLRMDFRTALSWRVDVESAVERLLGTVRVPALSRH